MQNMIQTLSRWLRHYSQINLALLDQALVSATNFLTSLILARYLGLENFGIYTLAWMLILFVNCIQQALVVAPMMSIGPKQHEKDVPAYYGAAFTQQIMISGFLSLIVFLGLSQSEKVLPWPELTVLALPVAFVILAFQMQDFIRRYFFTRGRAVHAFISDVISYFGQLLCLMTIAKSGNLTIETTLWAISATSTVAALIALPAVEPLALRGDVILRQCLHHLHFSKWLTLSAIMQWTSGNFFVAVAAAYLSSSAAGAIAAARNIVGPTLMLFTALENTIPSRAAAVYKFGGWASLLAYINQIRFVGALATAGICLTAMVFATPLMTHVFGDAYSQYAYLIYWFAPTHVLMFFIRPLSGMLRAVEHTKPIGIAAILPMIFSLVFSIPLIQAFGLHGAMIVMFGTQALMLACLAYSSFKLHRRYSV